MLEQQYAAGELVSGRNHSVEPQPPGSHVVVGGQAGASMLHVESSQAQMSQSPLIQSTGGKARKQRGTTFISANGNKSSHRLLYSGHSKMKRGSSLSGPDYGSASRMREAAHDCDGPINELSLDNSANGSPDDSPERLELIAQDIRRKKSMNAGAKVQIWDPQMKANARIVAKVAQQSFATNREICSGDYAGVQQRTQQSMERLEGRSRRVTKTKKSNCHASLAKEQLPPEAVDQMDFAFRSERSPKTMYKATAFSTQGTATDCSSTASSNLPGSARAKKMMKLQPRDIQLSKESLMAKVKKENACIMEFMAQTHDKLNNDFAAFLFVFKKTTVQMAERVRKDLDKRAFISSSRKLFSIYRYRIAITKGPGGPNTSMIDGDEEDAMQEPPSATKKEKQQKFSSCIHYYKRDLSPVSESFPQCNVRTPYRQNFSNYEVNMMSKDFKSSLLKSMGGNVRCIQSSDQNRRLSTYYNQQEFSQKKQPAGSLNLDQFMPKARHLMSSPEMKTATKVEISSSDSVTLTAKLKSKIKMQRLLNFDKLPKRKPLRYLAAEEDVEVQSLRLCSQESAVGRPTSGADSTAIQLPLTGVSRLNEIPRKSGTIPGESPKRPLAEILINRTSSSKQLCNTLEDAIESAQHEVLSREITMKEVTREDTLASRGNESAICTSAGPQLAVSKPTQVSKGNTQRLRTQKHAAQQISNKPPASKRQTQLVLQQGSMTQKLNIRIQQNKQDQNRPQLHQPGASGGQGAPASHSKSLQKTMKSNATAAPSKKHNKNGGPGANKIPLSGPRDISRNLNNTQSNFNNKSNPTSATKKERRQIQQSQPSQEKRTERTSNPSPQKSNAMGSSPCEILSPYMNLNLGKKTDLGVPLGQHRVVTEVQDKIASPFGSSSQHKLCFSTSYEKGNGEGQTFGLFGSVPAKEIMHPGANLVREEILSSAQKNYMSNEPTEIISQEISQLKTKRRGKVRSNQSSVDNQSTAYRTRSQVITVVNQAEHQSASRQDEASHNRNASINSRFNCSVNEERAHGVNASGQIQPQQHVMTSKNGLYLSTIDQPLNREQHRRRASWATEDEYSDSAAVRKSHNNAIAVAKHQARGSSRVSPAAPGVSRVSERASQPEGCKISSASEAAIAAKSEQTIKLGATYVAQAPAGTKMFSISPSVINRVNQDSLRAKHSVGSEAHHELTFSQRPDLMCRASSEGGEFADHLVTDCGYGNDTGTFDARNHYLSQDQGRNNMNKTSAAEKSFSFASPNKRSVRESKQHVSIMHSCDKRERLMTFTSEDFMVEKPQNIDFRNQAQLRISCDSNADLIQAPIIINETSLISPPKHTDSSFFNTRLQQQSRKKEGPGSIQNYKTVRIPGKPQSKTVPKMAMVLPQDVNSDESKQSLIAGAQQIISPIKLVRSGNEVSQLSNKPPFVRKNSENVTVVEPRANYGAIKQTNRNRANRSIERHEHETSTKMSLKSKQNSSPLKQQGRISIGRGSLKESASVSNTHIPQSKFNRQVLNHNATQKANLNNRRTTQREAPTAVMKQTLLNDSEMTEGHKMTNVYQTGSLFFDPLKLTQKPLVNCKQIRILKTQKSSNIGIGHQAQLQPTAQVLHRNRQQSGLNYVDHNDTRKFPAL